MSLDNSVKQMIEKDPNSITTYHEEDEEVFQYALDCGFVYNPKIHKLSELSSAFRQSQVIYEHILKTKPTFSHHFGSFDDEEKIRLAFEHGYKLTVKDLKRVRDFKNSSYIFNMLLEKNCNYIKYYTGYDDKIFEKAIQKGYKPKVIDLILNNQLGRCDAIIVPLIKKNPSLIKYYSGSDQKVYRLAMDLGYKPKEKDIEKNYTLRYSDDIFLKLIPNNYMLIEQYTGKNEDVFELAYNSGYKEDLIIKAISNSSGKYHALRESAFMLKKAIDVDVNNLKYYFAYDMFIAKNFDKSVVAYALEKGFKVTKDFYDKCNYQEKLEEALLDMDPNNVEFIVNELYYEMQSKMTVYKKAIERGYIPPKDVIISLESENWYKSILSLDLIKKKPEYVNLCKDVNLLIECAKIGIIPSKEVIESSDKFIGNLELMYYVCKIDSSYIKCMGYYNQKIIEFIIANNHEATVTDLVKEDIIIIPGLEKNLDYLKPIYEAIERSTEAEFINLYLNITSSRSNLREYIIEKKLDNFKNSENLKKFEDIIKYYAHNKGLFIQNADKFISFLSACGVDEQKFIQYRFGNSYDYLSVILKITESNKLDEFVQIKKFFFEKVFKDDTRSDVKQIVHFFDILKAYDKCPDLVYDIVNKNEISEKEIERIKAFLGEGVDLGVNFVPKKLDELQDIKSIMKQQLQDSISNGNIDITSIKNLLCNIMFSKSSHETGMILQNYGGRLELRQLLFDNRNNPDIKEKISDMMVYMTFMEDVFNVDNYNDLMTLAQNVINNFDLVYDCRSIFISIEDKLRMLYENELNTNLTRINQEGDLSGIIDKEMTSKTGVETYDLSDKKYCLLFHIKSRFETDEDLVYGKSSGSKNTICMSVGSQRNLVLYHNGGVCFVTDYLPQDSFIRSSVTNMGSNGSVKFFDSEDTRDDDVRKQRGALVTSMAPNGNNSEVFAFREGIEFKYIAIAKGEEPTQEEIEIAKQYGLKFIITQPLRSKIVNPQDLNDKEIKDNSVELRQEVRNELLTLRNALKNSKTGPRRFAVFTDVHGMFEPALAILEDIRKQGITEIYSLGDNIGSGPNPKEVMELLDEYGVKSIIGNHEQYVVDGVDVFKDHLSGAAYEEAKKNSDWTRAHLTPEQIEEIKKMPTEIQVEIANKIIYLTHYSSDLNTGEAKDISDEIDKIIQGHIHFKSDNGKITTLRGAGIGSDTGAGKASYTIITENEDGTYSMEEKIVTYNLDSFSHDVNESSMNFSDKQKIESWAGVAR